MYRKDIDYYCVRHVTGSGLFSLQDQLYFESASINDILSPSQNPNDLARYQNNIMTYISPSTKRLHDNIVANSPVANIESKSVIQIHRN